MKSDACFSFAQFTRERESLYIITNFKKFYNSQRYIIS